MAIEIIEDGRELTARTTVALTGSLVLSTGTSVRILVEVTHDGRLTRGEEQEIENSRIALHDLTPGAPGAKRT